MRGGLNRLTGVRGSSGTKCKSSDESGLPFKSISSAVEKARLEGQDEGAGGPKRSPCHPHRSFLNPAHGCRDAGERGERAQEDTAAGLGGR